MKKFNFTLGVFCLSSILLFSGCEFTSKGQTEKPSNENEITEENTEISPGKIEENITVLPPDQSKETELLPPVTPTDDPDISSSENNPSDNPINPEDTALGKYKSDIAKIASAAQSYYNDYFSMHKLISKNGKLYNYTSGNEVNPAYLSKMGYLSQSIADTYSCIVLLLKPADLNIYDEISSAGTSETLSVYVSAKSPRSDDYMIFSGSGYIGTLSSKNHVNLLEKYIQSHGSILRIYPGESPEYDRILNFIRMSEGIYEEYWVRCVYMDDLYSMVILSPKVNPSDIRQYLLKKNSTYWEVVMSDLESEARVVTAINKKYPDFNPSMLTKYTINDYRSSLKKSYTTAVMAFIDAKLIKSQEDLKYVCGAGNFCYATTEDGRYLLALLSGDTWDVYSYSSSWEVRKAIESRGSETPVFIVYDE